MITFTGVSRFTDATALSCPISALIPAHNTGRVKDITLYLDSIVCTMSRNRTVDFGNFQYTVVTVEI